MKYSRILFLLIIGLSFYACSSDSNSDNPSEETVDNFDRGAMLANWADNIIIPAYTNFKSKTSELDMKTADFAASPSEASLQTLRTAWENAYVSFQTVSMFEIGKAEEVRFRNRMNIYPTKTSKIEQFISSGEFDLSLPSAIDAQGFPAMDYLINGLGSTDAEIVAFYTINDNAEGYKNYLKTLSQNIATLSSVVLTDWNSGFRDTFVANTNSSATGAVDKLANDYIFYFEKSLRAGKVGIPAGIFSTEPLPQNVEAFYKKDISKELLQKATDASRDFFNGKSFNGSSNGQSFKSYLVYLNTIKNGANLGSLINDQFNVAKENANGLNDNFEQQIETDNSKMLNEYNELQRLVVLLKVDMLQAMNISIDYVDSDGD